MPKRDDVVLLNDMLDAIAQVETYLTQVPHSRFVESRLLQDGVMHEIEIIGEAARNLSENFREQHSAMAWQDIVGMRNRIAHGYFAVDLRSVWDTAKFDLPELRQFIMRILGETDA